MKIDLLNFVPGHRRHLVLRRLRVALRIVVVGDGGGEAHAVVVRYLGRGEREKVLLLCSYHAEKQFPTCCHAVAMQKAKVNVRK